MLMYVFSIELGWLPSFGRGDTANWFAGNLASHRLMVWLTLCFQVLLWLQSCYHRSFVSCVLKCWKYWARIHQIRQSERFSLNKIYYQHALKNTMLPVLPLVVFRLVQWWHTPFLLKRFSSGQVQASLILEAINRMPPLTAYVIFKLVLFS